MEQCRVYQLSDVLEDTDIIQEAVEEMEWWEGLFDWWKIARVLFLRKTRGNGK